MVLLNKPYTEKEKCDFIVKYNHNMGYTIKQTENGLEAIEPEKPTLDELKSKKKEEINQARDKAEQGGFEYLGKVFDSDAISCQRIALASQSALISKENGSDFSVVWTCQDNSTIELDADKMVGVSLALTQWSNNCHIIASELKAEVNKATTEDELNNIKWEE